MAHCTSISVVAIAVVTRLSLYTISEKKLNNNSDIYFYIYFMDYTLGRSQDFFSTEVKETEVRYPQGEGFLGGAATPLPPGGLGSAVSFPNGLRVPNGFHAFEVFRVAFPGSLVLFIVRRKGRIFLMLIILGVY